MRLTVVICTWNRAVLLRQTLDSMTQLTIPGDDSWELLVVNNNCTDETAEVLEAFEERLPLRVLSEPIPGKSHALNRAVMESTGDYILFTDDDVLVEPDWLEGYSRAFRRHPHAAFFGGPIYPWFAGDPPSWLVEAFDRVAFAFAALDLGDQPVSMEGRDGPLGANMAVRREEHRRLKYDTALGPRPGSGLRGEETALIKALHAMGATGYWVPEARVRHHVPEARQTVGFLREWYRGWGEYLELTREGSPPRTVLGRPLWLWREVVQAEVFYRYKRAMAPPGAWVEALKRTAIAQGRFASYGAAASEDPMGGAERGSVGGQASAP